MKTDSASTSPEPQSRRAFLQKTSALAAALGSANLLGCATQKPGSAAVPAAAAPGPLPAPRAKGPWIGRVLGANDRIVVAFIGTGKQGQTHIRTQKQHAKDNNIVLGAVCDLYQKHLDQARQLAGLGEADAYRDHRKLLERNDIDAVTISTVDNWHAQCTIDAIQAGKHVLCEKPMTRYLAEAFEVYDTVKASNRVYVIGSQGCMDPKWHKAAEWIRAGKIGPLVWAQGSYCRNNPKNSEWTFPVDPDANESNLDWYRWLGRVPRIPWNPDHYFSWHKYYAYNSGIIGNLLPHRFQPLMIATGLEYPRRVAATGTRQISTDRDITDTTHLLVEYPSGLTVVVAGSTVNEQGLPDIIRGRKATLYFASSQNKVELKPERIFSDELEAEEFVDPSPVESIPRLEKDFFDCIRSGATPKANIELAIRAQTVLSLAEMAERLSLTLLFDESTRQVRTGDGRVVKPISYEDEARLPKLTWQPVA